MSTTTAAVPVEAIVLICTRLDEILSQSMGLLTLALKDLKDARDTVQDALHLSKGLPGGTRALSTLRLNQALAMSLKSPFRDSLKALENATNLLNEHEDLVEALYQRVLGCRMHVLVSADQDKARHLQEEALKLKQDCEKDARTRMSELLATSAAAAFGKASEAFATVFNETKSPDPAIAPDWLSQVAAVEKKGRRLLELGHNLLAHAEELQEQSTRS